MKLSFFGAILVFLLAFSQHGFAQPRATYSLTGSVLDSESGVSLPGVNVFISGTTFGSATRNDGSFEVLVATTQPNVLLVASMIGYETAEMPINLASQEVNGFEIMLTPATIELDELVVIASNKEWKRQLKMFEKMAFSSTKFGEECIILNPEVLRFAEASTDENLIVTISGPLEIKNEALGYMITFYDTRFEGNDLALRWEGEFRFSEQEPTSKKQGTTWAENRMIAFLGSTRHFYRSLLAGNSKEQGFIFTEVETPGIIIENPQFIPDVSLLISDKSDQLTAISFEKTLMVSYSEGEPMKYREYVDRNGLRAVNEYERYTKRLFPRDNQMSWLKLNTSELLVDDLGNEFGKYTMNRYGYWAWERIGELLPTNFVYLDD